MTPEFTDGGGYFIHVDQDTLSVYVRLLTENDVIGTDDGEPYIYYRYPRENRLTESTFLDGYKVNHLASAGTWTGGGDGGDEENSAVGGETLNAVEPEETAEEIPLTIYSFALDGRRVGKAGFVNLTYLYDGENVVYELWDNKLVRFVHPVASGSCSGGCSGGCAGNSAGAFTDHPISISIDGVKYYYLYDGLGSVTELIDVNQNVVNCYRYTPFGEALARVETVYNPYQFTGRQYDAESGLYHYRARAYSPDVGRFMQQDPAGMIDGTNMFVYCGNDPVNNVDPTGLSWCSWKTGIILSIIGSILCLVITGAYYGLDQPAGYTRGGVACALAFSIAFATASYLFCTKKKTDNYVCSLACGLFPSALLSMSWGLGLLMGALIVSMSGVVIYWICYNICKPLL